MELIFKDGKIEIWKTKESYGFDYTVYSGDNLVRTCPSEGMALEVAAGV